MLDGYNTLIPFFFLKTRKGKDYTIFNPVDNREYAENYIAYWILEQCNGMYTQEEIAHAVEKEFELTNIESMDYVTVFLDEMYKKGMIAWRGEKISYEKDYPPPSTVFWDITGECNLRCTHCYNFEGVLHKNEMSTDEIKLVLEEMLAFGVGSINFSGGEPLLRKDFLEIASYAGSLGFRSVSIATNGTLINREIARQIKTSNLDVQVSIDGDVAEIHDLMRNVKSAFERAISGIKLLQEEGNEVAVCTTVTKLNVDSVPDIIQLMMDIGVKNYRVQGIMPMGRGKTNMEGLMLTPVRMKELVEFLEDKKIPVSSYNFTLKPPPIGHLDYSESGACSAATTSCSITPEGNVVPCTYFWGMNGDNLRDHTFQWIWQKSTLLNYFRNITLNDIKGSCRYCKWLSICHGGCKAENYSNGDILNSNCNCWIADEMRYEQGIKSKIALPKIL